MVDWIPLTALVLGIGVAFWSIYWQHQRKRLEYQERQLMIERGMTPPLELPSDKKDRFIGRSPEDCLRRGTINLFLGIGLAVVYFALGNAPDDELPWIAGAAGAIVGFLGLGNLMYYFLSRNRTPDDLTGKL